MASRKLTAGEIEELKLLHQMNVMVYTASHKLAERLDKEGVEVPRDINHPLAVIWANQQHVANALARLIKAQQD